MDTCSVCGQANTVTEYCVSIDTTECMRFGSVFLTPEQAQTALGQ